MLCFWNGYLRFYNPTPYDAFDLRVEFPASLAALEPEELTQKHLKATEVLELRLNVERELPRDEVVEARSAHRESELEPTELQTLMLRLSYRNAWGKRFYTTFQRAENNLTHHRLKPKLGAA